MLVVSAIVLSIAIPWQADAPAQVAAPSATGADPVERDMHEFMEYVFLPTYERLKATMAAAPADNKGWKAVKSDSLILAEGGNLLLLRLPDKDVQPWQELSVQTRELGNQLYQSAKKKDFPSARRHYETMLAKCNACHQRFAEGEHQLAP
jgi:hypothetical protein